MQLGALVGTSDCVGTLLGVAKGDAVGALVGTSADFVGTMLGNLEGVAEGDVVGALVGTSD
jgi:hypothetical protein